MMMASSTIWHRDLVIISQMKHTFKQLLLKALIMVSVKWKLVEKIWRFLIDSLTSNILFVFSPGGVKFKRTHSCMSAMRFTSNEWVIFIWGKLLGTLVHVCHSEITFFLSYYTHLLLHLCHRHCDATTVHITMTVFWSPIHYFITLTSLTTGVKHCYTLLITTWNWRLKKQNRFPLLEENRPVSPACKHICFSELPNVTPWASDVSVKLCGNLLALTLPEV